MTCSTCAVGCQQQLERHRCFGFEILEDDEKDVSALSRLSRDIFCHLAGITGDELFKWSTPWKVK
jgi:hypothetical protein